MADPLSITASVIAVVSAAEGIGKTLSKIRNIREAPNELLALINEVSDFRVILANLEIHLTNKTSNLHLQEQTQHMSVLLNRAKEQLLQLDELIQYRIVRPESTSWQIKLSRREWALARSTIKGFRGRLRDTRLDIIAQMTVINASVSRTHWLEAEGTNTTDRSYQSRIGLMIDEIHEFARSSEATGSRIGEERIVQRLNEQSGLLTNILHNQVELHGLIQLNPTTGSQDSLRLTTDRSSTSVISIKATLNYQRFPCTSSCRCNCHKSHHFISPMLVHRAIGTLILGYSGYPFRIFRRCTLSGCQGQQAFRISINYFFPSWSLARALVIAISKSFCCEIHVSLKVPRVVPNSAEVFRLTLLDDVTGLQQLFSKGIASPYDVNIRGRGPLFVSLSFSTDSYF